MHLYEEGHLPKPNRKCNEASVNNIAVASVFPGKTDGMPIKYETNLTIAVPYDQSGKLLYIPVEKPLLPLLMIVA